MTAQFKERLKNINPAYTQFDALQTLQVNIGNLCNLQCAHCHVKASPAGSHVMAKNIVEEIIEFLKCREGVTLDITGGCPEMHPHFRFLIEGTSGLSPRRMVRSNLVIMDEDGMEWLPKFCREHGLVIVASLPCYLQKNVDRQRGEGVFVRSIRALQTLNTLGYGTELELNLVYNPGGECLPGSQCELERAYREQLRKYGVRFNNLYTITNAPIGRFKEYLEGKGAYDRYLELLAAHFNPDVAHQIMCRTLVNVDFQGILYNCDFNQALDLPITDSEGRTLRIDDLNEVAQSGKELFLAQHCYCCTAGEGSSCTGSLAA